MRLFVNADLVFNSTPPPPLHQNGHNRGFAAEMTRRGNRGKVLPRLFHRSPALGNPAKGAGLPHSRSDDDSWKPITPKMQTRSNWGSVHFLVENHFLRSPGWLIVPPEVLYRRSGPHQNRKKHGRN